VLTVGFGSFKANPVMSHSLWVDADNALNVTLRKNGEYVIFLENAALNLVMMFRWRPPKR
jgi:hypothetical protein